MGIVCPGFCNNRVSIFFRLGNYVSVAVSKVNHNSCNLHAFFLVGLVELCKVWHFFDAGRAESLPDIEHGNFVFRKHVVRNFLTLQTFRAEGNLVTGLLGKCQGSDCHKGKNSQ